MERIPRATSMLVAYDGTPSARRALQRAVALHRDECGVSVINVNEHGDDRAGHLEEARRVLAANGIESQSIAVAGSAAHAICVVADRDCYDMIIVGRRNLRDMGQLLPGSVAARVVSGAMCDVVVVA